MKFLKKLTYSLALMSFFTINAQHNHSPKCFSAEMYKMQLENDAQFKQNIKELNEQAVNYANTQQKTNAVITIPVVFHILYQNATENISTQRINEQMDVLNQDFRKLNHDADSVSNAFKPFVADCEIQFCLASVDPSGNSTTGINRVSTTVSVFNPNNNNMKFASSGGADVWDRNKYLNIWVCDLGTELLGYAQFPGGTASTDGVVLNYPYVGKTGASSPYNLGRTATHEVGHYLGLYHIWGDDEDCSGSDLVSDTPNQEVETTGNKAPKTVVIDDCSPNAPGIMWMNYMDYTNDASLYMFTAGQKTRMQNSLTNSSSRSGLNNSSLTNCQAALPYNNEFSTNPTTDGWTINTTNTGRTWTRVTNAGFNGNNSMKMDNYNSPDITGQLDHLNTKELNFTGYSNSYITYQVAYARYETASQDSLKVYYSTNSGTNWNLISAKGGASLETTSGPISSEFTPISTQWRKDSIAVPQVDGKSSVKFRFTSKSGYGNNVYLDDATFTATRTNTAIKANLKLFDDVNIYPNPASDILNIAGETIQNVEIYNISGQKVFESVITEKLLTIDLSALNSGIYIVRIKTTNDILTNKINIIK